MIRALRLTLLCAALAALAWAVPGCVARHAATGIPGGPDAAWKAFRDRFCVAPAAPGVLVKASLYYTRVKPTRRTNRTLLTLWGSFDGAMRLDLAAGVGRILAHIREDRRGLLVYYPEERKAYAHRDALVGAARLGMPFPFSLNQLARVTVGDFSGLVPKRAGQGVQAGANFRYAVTGRAVTAVTLAPGGLPVRIEGRTAASAGGRTWILDIEAWDTPEDGGTPQPGRLTLAMADGETGALRIRSRALRLASWPAGALDLALPDGTAFRRLDTGAQPVGDADIPVIYEDK